MGGSGGSEDGGRLNEWVEIKDDLTDGGGQGTRKQALCVTGAVLRSSASSDITGGLKKTAQHVIDRLLLPW